jgi:hypothetical protein
MAEEVRRDAPRGAMANLSTTAGVRWVVRPRSSPLRGGDEVYSVNASLYHRPEYASPLEPARSTGKSNPDYEQADRRRRRRRACRWDWRLCGLPRGKTV